MELVEVGDPEDFELTQRAIHSTVRKLQNGGDLPEAKPGDTYYITGIELIRTLRWAEYAIHTLRQPSNSPV